VSQAADWRIVLDPSASFIIASAQLALGISASTDAGVSGTVSFSRSADGTQLEFADILTAVNDFSLSGPFGIDQTNVTSGSSFVLNRFVATQEPDGGYVVLSGQAKIGIQAFVNGVLGHSIFVTQGDLDIDFDPSANFFSMDGSGNDGNGHSAVLHLQGSIQNHPPTAIAGPNHDVECTSSTTTPVALDAGASTPNDPGDFISHCQWFENGIGVSNQCATSVDATFGPHAYELHVYDQYLGSSMTTQTIKVVDTKPPVLSVSPVSACLWPPNHKFSLFELGRDIQYTVFDKCDPHPLVWIYSVVSDEPSNAPGSGNTAPDVVAGTQAFCVRSERSGTGVGRTYTVTVKARSLTCLETTATVQIFVPHDQSAHPQCEAPTGGDLPTASCSAGSPVPPNCVPPP
jgi:hypothetical protein